MTNQKQSEREVDWDSALAKLSDLTTSGSLEWKAEHSFQGRGNAELTGPAFSAAVNGRRVLIYEYRYKAYTDTDEGFWSTGVSVEFVDRALNLQYQWGGTSGNRWGLLDAIRYRDAGVSEFLSEFLTN